MECAHTHIYIYILRYIILNMYIYLLCYLRLVNIALYYLNYVILDW